MELAVYNIKGEDTGRKVTLNDEVFGRDLSEGNAEHTLYLDIKQYLGNQRQGTHKSKERSEVSYSTRKIGRQKGGGGARRIALTSRANDNKIIVVENFQFDAPKTKNYMALAKSFKLEDKKVLLVFPENNENVYLSVRNVPNALLMRAQDLNAYSVLNNDAMLVTEDSVAIINDFK